MLRARYFAPVFVAIAAGCGRREPLPYSGFVDEPVSAVATQVAGKVDSTPVKEGDRVRKGQLLAQLEAATREAAVAEAEANLERARRSVDEAEANLASALPAVKGAGADIARARATRDEAKQNFERVQRLTESRSVSQADLDAARARLLEAQAALDSLVAAKAQTRGKLAATSAALDTARIGVRSSEAALQLAQAELAQTHIVSPFDGLVVARDLEEGEWAGAGTPVVTVEDTSHPWVRLDVEETRFGRLRLDEAALVRVIALPGRTFRGHVSQIGAQGDFAIDRDVKRGRPDVRTFLVRVAFDEVPAELRPGMTAEVRLQGDVRSPCPQEAQP